MGAGRDGARALDDSDALDHGARLGLVVYGVLHVVVAFVAVRIAWGGSGGDEASQQGAFALVAQNTFGRSVLYVVAAGFAGLVVWQALEAWRGHRDEEGTKRAFTRAGSAAKAVTYAALGYSAAAMALGSGGGGGGEKQTDNLTAQVMSAPGGRLLVGAVGLGLVAVGVYLGYRGIAEKFMKRLESQAPRGDSGSAVVWLGKVGYLGKGASLAAVGMLFVTAAVRFEPEESGGLDVALRELSRQPFGPYLLTAVALGLAAYGLFSMAWARYLDR